jgi:ankyrin repeat protein
LERIRKIKSALTDAELKRLPSTHSIILRRKEGINDALTKDDPEILEQVFSHFRVDMYQVMEAAAARKALKCISWLTELPKSWTDPIPNSLYSQSILHRIVSKSGNDPTVILHLLKAFHSDTAHILLLSRDEAGRRPMHYAAVLGYDEIVRILLDALPNAFDLPGWGDNDGHSPLDLAITKGNENVARIILEYPNWGNWQKAQYPNEMKPHDSGYLLLVACALGRTVIVKILLENGVDIFSVNNDGEVIAISNLSRIPCMLLLRMDSWKR